MHKLFRWIISAGSPCTHVRTLHYNLTQMTLLAEMDADACVESGSGATDTDPNSPELGSCEAVTYLLALIMPSVPAAVLREKFSDAAAVFGALLHALGQVHAPIARHLVECVTVLVGVQEVGGWSGSALNGLVQSVLSMTVDPRPKVGYIVVNFMQQVRALTYAVHATHVRATHVCITAPQARAFQSSQDPGASAGAHGLSSRRHCCRPLPNSHAP